MNPQPTLIVNRVLPVDNVEGAGVQYEAILSPKLYPNGNTNNAYECLNDTVGWIVLQFDLLGITSVQPQQLVIGWSYLSNDGVNVKALVNAQIARIGAGVDGIVARNVRSVQLDPLKFPIEISADPYNTIKTVYSALSGIALPTGFFVSASGTKPS